ncbi:cell division protein FtsQ/DivIB [Marinoscillum furvescens]|uniref:Cell division protein FtsQ n=1 Tax=Marinoscillum furvescens DSM 4134 TaxID=1122208 RepID=A0A3D9KZK1_MARFU|nr:cell division protein FtsQ [Marinoscillum furvescens]RED92448.1 cell division protein FtsQ [Marinoscillum furvescens DSM 4134]
MKREIKTIVILSSTVVVMLAIIGFTGVKSSSRPVNDVLVTIEDQDGDFFTDQLEVLNLLNDESTDYVLGLAIDDLDLKELERRVERNPFIKDAQVYRDIKGNLMVKVQQVRPIARVFSPSGPDQYISVDGELLPTTARHTARVPIIELERSFSWEQNITETEYGQELLNTLKYIDGDKFWKAQIAHIVIARDGELTFLPQVTKQEVKFGMPEKLEKKFRKLKVFYKEILPNKGWNTYSMVNLKFENQIVCE